MENTIQEVQEGLIIRLFGETRVTYNGVPVNIDSHDRLLALLAPWHNKIFSYEQLIKVHHPDSYAINPGDTIRKARTWLCQGLARAMDIELNRHDYQDTMHKIFNLAKIDVVEFDKYAKAHTLDELRQAYKWYTGLLLEGWGRKQGGEPDEITSFISIERSKRRNTFDHVFNKLILLDTERQFEYIELESSRGFLLETTQKLIAKLIEQKSTKTLAELIDQLDKKNSEETLQLLRQDQPPIIPTTEEAPATLTDPSSLRKERSFEVPYRSFFDSEANLERYGLYDVNIYRNTMAKHIDASRIVHSPAPDQHEAQDQPSCSFSIFHRNTHSDHHQIDLVLRKTTYYDFLRSRDLLTARYPRTQKNYREFFRDEFLTRQHWTSLNFDEFLLSNICGAGFFLLAGKNVIVSRHAVASHVYPNAWTYTASGTLGWGAWPSPFTEIMYRARQEIDYQIDPHHLYLYDIGVDTLELFFQFSMFYDNPSISTDEIDDKISEVNGRSDKTGPEALHAIALHHASVAKFMFDEAFEPAARKALILLCEKTQGVHWRENFQNQQLELWAKWEKRMRDQWRDRATQHGLLPIMTERYLKIEGKQLSLEDLKLLSNNFTEAIITFIGTSLDNAKTVVDVGSGLGRFTEILLERKLIVTSIEFCEEMLSNPQVQLGNDANHRIFRGFAQDYKSDNPHDIAVCSLVLIHNVEDTPFRCLVESLCHMAKKLFVFEDISSRSPTGHFTKLRSEAELREAFRVYDYEIVKKKNYKLAEDDILFLQLEKKS